MADLVWLIPAFPLAGFLLILLFGRRLGDPKAGYLATAMVFASFAVAAGIETHIAHGRHPERLAAIITRGIIALLVRVFSYQKPADIIDAPTDFIDEIGLKEHLSPTRANGLVSMIKQIKLYAIAYQTQIKS